MAFSLRYAVRISILFEIAIISGIASEIPESWKNFGGPFALVRLRRTPQRAFTYSGFNPSNGITALATSADFLPPYYNYQSLSSLTPSQYSQYNYGLRARVEPESSSSSPSDYSPDYQPPPSEYPPSDPNSEDRSLPSANLTPPSEQAPTTNYNQNPVQSPKKFKKKPQNVEEDDDDDDDNVKSKSKSTSNASFNAWFPIVLGMYPSRGGNANAANVLKEDVENEPSKSYYPNSYTDRELGTTVIANSVSHGKSSVASSHAIAYGGEPSMKSYKKG